MANTPAVAARALAETDDEKNVLVFLGDVGDGVCDG